MPCACSCSQEDKQLYSLNCKQQAFLPGRFQIIISLRRKWKSHSCLLLPTSPNISPPTPHLPLLILLLLGHCMPPPSRAAHSHQVLLRPVPSCSHPTVLSMATLAVTRKSFPLGTLCSYPFCGNGRKLCRASVAIRLKNAFTWKFLMKDYRKSHTSSQMHYPFPERH